MLTVKFRVAEYGIIEHKNGKCEVVKSVEFFDSPDEAKAKIDELAD